MQFTMFTGIDVSKKWLDFAVLLPGQEAPVCFRCANTTNGITKALDKIQKLTGFEKSKMLFCMEHTGLYCRPFLSIVGIQGLKVGIESAWKIKRTQSPRGKSDTIDAQRIADYAQRYQDRIRLWEPEPKIVEAIREHLAVRERLIRARNMLKVPIKEAKKMNFEAGAKISKRASDPAIKAISKQIKQLDKDLEKLIDLDSETQRNLKLVTSIPGIGRQTGLSLIMISNNFTRFNCARSMACYSGLAPFPNSSGSSIKGKTKVSHYANKDIKKVIHMAALSAIRHNPDLKAYYKRKVSQGKNKMSVINAVRNKLLHIVFALIKRGTPWEEAKFSKSKENLA